MQFRSLIGALVTFIGAGCVPTQKCGETADDLSTCSIPTMDADYYVEQSQLYFNTMDVEQDRDVGPDYGEQVARWEWPPWLKLTAFGRQEILDADLLLRLYESTVPERDCRAFDQQPFGRCRVTFYYAEHEGKGCPIYEEFTFNDQGEMTFIEAWSDLSGMLPMAEEDPWAEGENVSRLSTRIPGLGSATGAIDLSSEAMLLAAEQDADVADFAARAADWRAAWLIELEAAGDDLWERGCGWVSLGSDLSKAAIPLKESCRIN